MAVFTQARIATMSTTLDRLLATHRPTRSARFVAVFEADDEALTIEVADGAGQVRRGRHGSADFGFSGRGPDWELYFAERPVSHSSLVAMMVAADVSSGEYPSSLLPSGDVARLFANLPIYNAVIESATVGGSR